MDMDHTQALENRLRRLEDIEAIRQLKAEYLNASDRKDARAYRECFAPGEIEIDFGHIGVFRSRDELGRVFEKYGCHDHLLEMHHGANPRIEITSTDTARGDWALYFQDIDTRERSLMQLGLQYDDEYIRLEEGWRIQKSIVRVMSTLLTTFSDEHIKVISATRKPNYSLGE